MSEERKSSRASEIVVQNGRLYHLGFTRGEVAENLILVGDPARALRVAEFFDVVDHEIRNREFVTLTGRYGDLPVSVIGTGIGTDNVEIALIEALTVHAFDLESGEPLPDPPQLRIVRVGTSGGAQTDIDPGTLAISEYALGCDATGLYYDHRSADPRVAEIEVAAAGLLEGSIDPGSRFKGWIRPYAARATPALFETVERVARDRDRDVVTGITVTSSGFYGPSSRVIEGLVNTVPDIKGTLARLLVDGRRVVNFEMESSLIFHLSEALGLHCCTVCPVISRPDSHDAVIDYAPRIDLGIEIALTALVESTR